MSTVNIHQYAVRLSAAMESFKDLADDTKSVLHEFAQAKNDYESLKKQSDELREKIAAMETDLKTRHAQFEAGLKRINDEAIARHNEAVAALKEAEHDRECAKRDRAIASQLLDSAKEERKEVAVVASGGRKPR